MSLIQGLTKIKNGIENGDMQLIADGYELLSGEKISLSPKEVVEKNGKRGRPKKVNITVPNGMSSKTPILLGREKKPNKFVDTGELFQEDKAIDNKLHVKPPVERRPTPKIVSINCDSCGTKFDLLEDLIFGDSKKYCNKCCRR